MKGYRWHSHYWLSTKRDADKVANRLRRNSAHRNRAGFKVRVRELSRGSHPWAKYVVEWYGHTTLL